MSRPPRSKVWLHFIKIDANTARCNVCQKALSAKSGNTSNLMKHLTVHGIYLKAESCQVFDCKKQPQPSTSQDSCLPDDEPPQQLSCASSCAPSEMTDSEDSVEGCSVSGGTSTGRLDLCSKLAQRPLL